MKKMLILILLYSPLCFAQKSIYFNILKVYSRDQNEAGTWNDWQDAKLLYIGFNIDFDDNEIVWYRKDSINYIKYITELLLNSKIDDRYKNVGFRDIKLTGAGLKDDKNIIYEIAYLDKETIMFTSDAETQTKYILQSQ